MQPERKSRHLESLKELREDYLAEVAECEQFFARLTKQVGHLDALIDDLDTTEESPIYSEPEPLDTSSGTGQNLFNQPKPSLLPSELLPLAYSAQKHETTSLEADGQLEKYVAVQEAESSIDYLTTETDTNLLNVSTKEKIPAIPTIQEEMELPPLAQEVKTEECKAEVKSLSNFQRHDNRRGRKGYTSRNSTSVELLPEHQGTQRLKLIERLLEQNSGIALHVEYIVRSLYGALDPGAFRVAKGRVMNVLKRGQNEELWDKVPDQRGYYTIDLALLDAKKAV